MGEETELRNILIAEMAVELPCTHPNCTYGVDGTPYKTPALDGALAFQVLELHVKSHGVRGACWWCYKDPHGENSEASAQWG